MEKILNRKIKVALVGCGRVSKNHFFSIKKYSDDIELIAICDSDLSLVENLTKDLSVKGFTDLENMLETVDFDLLIITTPSGLHAEHAEIAARYGKHVITEKPMATNYLDAKNMIKSFDRYKKHLFVVKQNRYNSTLQILRKAISEKRFGKIHLVQVNVFWTRPQNYYDQASWRGTWEFDGGALMNQASHYVDLLHWLIGPLESIHAFSSTSRAIEAEDTIVANLKWRNGALGSFNASMLTYPKNLEGSISIFGENGTIKIGGHAGNEIEIWDFDSKAEYDEEISEASYETSSVYGLGHPVFYENIVKFFRGVDSAQVISGRDGIKSLEIIIAAYESVRDRCIKGFPLKF